MTDPQFYYRLEDVAYAASVDEWGHASGPGSLEVVTRKYRVVKVTPCGVWLDIGRFVRNGTRKQFAHPTMEGARESFAARKRRQAEIYEARAHRARRALSMANGELF